MLILLIPLLSLPGCVAPGSISGLDFVESESPPTQVNSRQQAPVDMAEIEAQLRQAHAVMVKRAFELGTQARELGYFSASRSLFEFVIHLDPEHAKARKRLGMRKKDTEWVARELRPKKDKVDPEELLQFDGVKAAFFKDAVLRVDEIFRGLDPTPALTERHRRELDRLNTLEPNDTELRKRTGYEKEAGTGAWILWEVAQARRSLMEDERLLNDIRAQLPKASPADLNEGPATTGIPFPVVLESERLQVASTLADEEAQVVYDSVLTVLDYMTRSFEIKRPEVLITGVFCLTDPALKPGFFAKHPLAKQSEMIYYMAVNGCFLGFQIILSAPTAQERKDMGTFLAATSYLRWNFGERGASGWIRQSLSSYLAFAVCKTHLSYLVTQDQYGQSKGLPWPERMPPDLNGWLAAARPLLEKGVPLGKFTHAITSPTKNMNWEDVLLGYAFSAYLFEGRREDLKEILKALGHGKEKVATLENTLGMPMPAIRDRLALWIDGMESTN